jgi:hypothetical protein
VYWYHDETTFAAHNWWPVYWQKTGTTSAPQPKGEGATLMVADFVSADYGWLCSPDETETAQVLFRVGKNQEGYFTSNDILAQVTTAIDILQRHYPFDAHIFIYDNAPTHLKRAANLLSARHMSLKPTKAGKNYWFGAEVPAINEATGKTMRKGINEDRDVITKKIPMTGAKSADGSSQSLYFSEGHPHAGVFKGMEVILKEHGINITGKLS